MILLHLPVQYILFASFNIRLFADVADVAACAAVCDGPACYFHRPVHRIFLFQYCQAHL